MNKQLSFPKIFAFLFILLVPTVAQIVQAAPTDIILFDESSTFWAKSSGGVGSYDIAISSDTTQKVSGLSSLSFKTIQGTKSWVNIKHSYSTSQDWSIFDVCTFDWYGKNTGLTFTLSIESPDYSNSFSYRFVDDFVGWKEIRIQKNAFVIQGAASWTQVRSIILSTTPKSVVSWNLDSMILLDTSVTPTNSPPYVDGVKIAIAAPTILDVLDAKYNYHDSNGDVEIIAARVVKWYKNDLLQTGYNNKLSVPASALISGNSWYFTIQVSDGSALSTIVSSPKVVIQTPTVSWQAVLHDVDDLSRFSSSQLTAIGKKYSVLIASPGSFNVIPFKTIRAANPSIMILMYRNIHAIDSNSYTEINYARSKGWILKDIYGKEIYEKGWTEMKMVDVGNTEFQTYLANLLKTNMAQYGFDGVFGDNTSPMIETLYGVNADGVNPRTKKVYSDTDYRNDMVNLVKKVRTAISPDLFIGNGVGYQQGGEALGFWSQKTLVEPLINAMDGCVIEGLVRWSGEPWRTVASWVKDIDALQYFSNKGVQTFSWINMYGGIPSGSTNDQVAMFGITSYLLGKSVSKAYYNLAGYDYTGLLGVNIGTPVESYHIRSGSQVYEREYSNTLVLVNPSSSGYTISLGKSFRTINGLMVTSIYVASHTGLILIK